MRKKILSIISIVTMIFFVACSNEDIVKDAANDTPDASRVLSFTASMPSEPTPRVALEENADKSIDLSWEAGDEIKFAFVQGETIANATSTVASISNGGKTAQFAISLPEGINNAEKFTLHGVYGGGELVGTEATLPNNPSVVASLQEIDMVLTFTHEVTSLESIEVNFNHLGSLFNVSLKNSGSASLDNLQDIRLVGTEKNTNDKWAYNAFGEGQVYDLAEGAFKNQELSGNGNIIVFAALKEKGSLAVDETVTLWGWYPLVPEKEWPALELKVLSTEEGVVLADKLYLDKKTPVIGRNYSIYVMYDGAAFHLTDETLALPEASLEVTVNVSSMGGLQAALDGNDLLDIKKLTLTGQINATDFEFMKTQLPNMTYLDMEEVACDGNKIPEYAFGNYNSSAFSEAHKSLASITLPNTINTIETNAFAKCESLTTVLNWPETLVEIKNLAFRDTPLTGVLEFKSTEGLALGGRAFSGCVNLTGMDFSTMTKYSSIAGNVFENCTGLTGRITFGLPQSQIAKDAFNGCSSDLTFRIPRNNVINYNAHPFPEHSTVEVKESMLAEYQENAGWGSGYIKLVGYTE